MMPQEYTIIVGWAKWSPYLACADVDIEEVYEHVCEGFDLTHTIGTGFFGHAWGYGHSKIYTCER